MQTCATLDQGSDYIIVDNKWDLQQVYEEHMTTSEYKKFHTTTGAISAFLSL